MLKFMKAYAFAMMLTLGLASFFAARAIAEEGRISGSVVDFDGKPWASLPIRIKSDQGATQETKTDEKGLFIFMNLKSGKYLVTVLAPQLKEPFELVVQVNGPDTPPVNVNFKEILEKQNPEAAAAYKKQNEDKSKVEGMKEHFNNGVALLDQEKVAKAELLKAPADKKEEDKAKVADLAAKAVTEFQEAQKAAPEKDPNSNLFWARIGEAYDLAGRNDDAINAYKQAIALKPENASYYNNLGNILGRTGKIDEAREAYSKSAELDPPNAAMAWRNFGISLYQVGRMQEAVDPLKKSIEIDPKNAQSYYLLGTCLVASADYKQVGDKMEVTLKPGTVEAYQKAVELDPTGVWGKQAKEGLEQVNQLTGGIDMKTGKKKKS
jgi:tetratricopeptide (TPR) repeat protein